MKPTLKAIHIRNSLQPPHKAQNCKTPVPKRLRQQCKNHIVGRIKLPCGKQYSQWSYFFRDSLRSAMVASPAAFPYFCSLRSSRISVLVISIPAAASISSFTFASVPNALSNELQKIFTRPLTIRDTILRPAEVACCFPVSVSFNSLVGVFLQICSSTLPSDSPCRKKISQPFLTGPPSMSVGADGRAACLMTLAGKFHQQPSDLVI